MSSTADPNHRGKRWAVLLWPAAGLALVFLVSLARRETPLRHGDGPAPAAAPPIANVPPEQERRLAKIRAEEAAAYPPGRSAPLSKEDPEGLNELRARFAREAAELGEAAAAEREARMAETAAALRRKEAELERLKKAREEENRKPIRLLVEIARPGLVPGEPIALKVTLANDTDDTLAGSPALAPSGGRLVVRIAGPEEKELSPVPVSGALCRPIEVAERPSGLPPRSRIVLHSSSPVLVGYAPKSGQLRPGPYRLRLSLQLDDSGARILDSDELPFVVAGPEGEDRVVWNRLLAERWLAMVSVHPELGADSLPTGPPAQLYLDLERAIRSHPQSAYVRPLRAAWCSAALRSPKAFLSNSEGRLDLDRRIVALVTGLVESADGWRDADALLIASDLVGRAGGDVLQVQALEKFLKFCSDDLRVPAVQVRLAAARERLRRDGK